MARKKQSQSMDRLINSIESILKNRCSQSDEDLILMNALANLQNLKRKKGKTNKEILETGNNVLELIAKYFEK